MYFVIIKTVCFPFVSMNMLTYVNAFEKLVDRQNQPLFLILALVNKNSLAFFPYSVERNWFEVINPFSPFSFNSLFANSIKRIEISILFHAVAYFSLQ